MASTLLDILENGPIRAWGIGALGNTLILP